MPGRSRPDPSWPRCAPCSPTRSTPGLPACPPSAVRSRNSTECGTRLVNCLPRTRPGTSSGSCIASCASAVVWCRCTPNVAKRSEILRFFEQSTGRFGRAPLKTSFLTAADLKSQPGLIHLMIAAAKAVNKVGNADFRWQHLPVPFEVFADGMDLVVFEEFGSGTAALNVREVLARSDLLATQDYRRWFRRDLERRHGATVWHRDLHEATILSCPDPTVVGRVLRRGRSGTRNPPRGRVPRSGRGSRRRSAVAYHDRQRPPEGSRSDRDGPDHPHGLRRFRRASAQHGLLQRRAAFPRPGSASRTGRLHRS